MEPAPRNAVLVVPGAQRSDVLALAGDRRWEWRVYRSDQSSTTLQEVLQQKPLPVAAVIDASADKPVQLARLIQAGAPLAQIVFVASAEDEARLQGALRTSPLVDAHWVILGRNSLELERELGRQVAVGAQRVRYRTTINRINSQLAAGEAAEPPTLQRLVISEKYLATLVESSPDAIITLSLRREILSWNASAAQLWGYAATTVTARRFEEFLDAFDRAPFISATDAVAARNSSLRIEATAMTASETSVPIEMTLSRVCDEKRNVIAYLVIARDITEHKQFLRAQRMESVGTLASGIAHNLNNMLMPVVMGTDLLREMEDRPDNLAILENIERAARRAVELVSQVLLFGRGVEGARVPLDLGDLVRQVMSMADSTFPKNITFKSSIGPGLWPVRGDQTQLVQVLLNLCINARDAMPEGGELTVTARNAEVGEPLAAKQEVTAGRFVVIEVTDTGCGISKENIDRIFEPFFSTKEIGRGTGLGLSTALAIVRGHRGFVSLESEIGQGSVFRVHLPAHTDAVGADARGLVAGKPPHGNGELVLVVDDEPLVLSTTKRMLLASGYNVVTAENGAAALEQFARLKTEIAVVLTDLMMPVMDGFALIRALQTRDPSLPIIATSGLAVGENVAKVKEAGIAHFLVKPYTVDAVLHMLATILAERVGRAKPL